MTHEGMTNEPSEAEQEAQRRADYLAHQGGLGGPMVPPAEGHAHQQAARIIGWGAAVRERDAGSLELEVVGALEVLRLAATCFQSSALLPGIDRAVEAAHELARRAGFADTGPSSAERWGACSGPGFDGDGQCPNLTPDPSGVCGTHRTVVGAELLAAQAEVRARHAGLPPGVLLERDRARELEIAVLAGWDPRSVRFRVHGGGRVRAQVWAGAPGQTMEARGEPLMITEADGRLCVIDGLAIDSCEVVEIRAVRL